MMAPTTEHSPKQSGSWPPDLIPALGFYWPVPRKYVEAFNVDISQLHSSMKFAEKQWQKFREKNVLENAPTCNFSSQPGKKQYAPKCTDAAAFSNDARQILRSKRCLQAAMVKANRRRRLSDRVGPRELILRSYQFDVLKDLSEIVTIHHVKKSDGSGHRLLHDFGPVARGAQLMVADLQKMIYQPRWFQMPTLGAGQKVQLAMELIQHGNVWLGEFDITNFFDSYELSELNEALPLPKGAVTQIVGALSGVRVYPMGTEYLPLSPKAHPGIPQGSAASAEVASWSVAHLPVPDFKDVFMLNHVDNFYLLGKDRKRVEAALEALWSGISGCPGGPFTGKVKQSTNIKDGFIMLGCALGVENGVVIALPTDAALKKLDRRFGRETREVRKKFEKAVEAGGAYSRQTAVIGFVNLVGYVNAWRQAYAFCNAEFVGAIVADFHATINSLATKYAVSEAEVKDARRFMSKIDVDTY